MGFRSKGLLFCVYSSQIMMRANKYHAFGDCGSRHADIFHGVLSQELELGQEHVAQHLVARRLPGRVHEVVPPPAVGRQLIRVVTLRNLPPERRRQLRERWDSLTPEQRERMLSLTPQQRQRLRDMTPEQRQRARDRMRRDRRG